MSAVTRDQLMAYADGQLTDAERRDVEAYLAANPDAAADIALMQRQSDAIRTLFAPAGAEPVPLRLKPRRIAAERVRRRGRTIAWAVAAMVLLGVGLGAGWFLRPVLQSSSASAVLIADAVNAHSVYVAESRHAVEVGSAESEHLTSWLSNRLDTPLGMPDLTSQGFTLVGGRLLPGEADLGGRAAQLMYENAAKERITIYVTAALADRQPAYQFTRYDGAAAFYWANARITCTVVGTLPEDRMKAVSQAVYAELTKDDGTGGRYRG